MAQLITKFKFIKSGEKAGNYLKYIATRDGVDKIDDSKSNMPTTKKQQNLIEKILKDFPDTKEMHEYNDYIKSKTIGSASEFITRAIEDNSALMMSKKTYADYIATRPRAERFGSHGLFTDDGIEIKLSDVSKELNAYQGNVWTAIISLRREDAERLGFNNGARWRDMLRTETQNLAENLKIPVKNLRWFAAFHNESHHPHVHLIAYSVIENEGYLTKKGVNNLRSTFAKDIFSQDLISIYEKQTEHRNSLKRSSEDIIADVVAKINTDSYSNPVIEELLLKLADRLSKTGGKKVYGYLKADVKDIVDKIVDELSKDKLVSALYDLWYEQREAVLKTYTQAMPPRVPLSKNTEFKSIKNAVIKEALTVTIKNGISKTADENDDVLDDNSEATEKSDTTSASKNTPTTHTYILKNGALKTKTQKKYSAAMSTIRLLHHISRLIQNQLKDETDNIHDEIVDRKLRRKIEEKKQNLGLKQ